MSGHTAGPGFLPSTGRPLCEEYDVAILDLDGTVYVGPAIVPGAAEAIRAVRGLGMRCSFVTNNASRTPAQLADHLTGLGVPADPADVVTSAQAAARLLAARLPAGSAVLVVGGEGLRWALASEGLASVETAADAPLAVVQGWAPELGWRSLAEGAYALREGVPWVATNTDLTLPTAAGIAPGNGSFVALLAAVTGRQPDAVAGKPGPTLLSFAAEQAKARRPLVVGDRLDTDIAGALAAGMDSLLVLTGVSGARDVLGAGPDRRPTYLGADLGSLLVAQPAVREEAGAHAPTTRSEAVSLLRAAASSAWTRADTGHEGTPAAGLGSWLDDLDVRPVQRAEDVSP